MVRHQEVEKHISSLEYSIQRQVQRFYGKMLMLSLSLLALGGGFGSFEYAVLLGFRQLFISTIADENHDDLFEMIYYYLIKKMITRLDLDAIVLESSHERKWHLPCLLSNGGLVQAHLASLGHQPRFVVARLSVSPTWSFSKQARHIITDVKQTSPQVPLISSSFVDAINVVSYLMLWHNNIGSDHNTLLPSRHGPENNFRE